ncbi:hypothetical protein PPYR_03112 [Photinus pyralis]|uniref:DUF753 domain-containing protein n=1 Tax=Photinus pyralis TaxID=7054 RepID=A0A5N4A1W5_PHOPY|nr:uncharacterized protein LOC116160949 [Photinus pyralis]KAB0791312.1 hypothetical protein PPYR_03112 [Photinus pyralis]
MYFKVILLTVTLFLYCVPSSDALSCLVCNSNSTDCVSGKNLVDKLCVGDELADKACISYLSPGRVVVRSCHITSGIPEVCSALIETYPTNKRCKTCIDDKCNNFDYSDIH